MALVGERGSVIRLLTVKAEGWRIALSAIASLTFLGGRAFSGVLPQSHALILHALRPAASPPVVVLVRSKGAAIINRSLATSRRL